MENSRKISYDQNDQPPKNYIWYKNGKYLEWNGEKWVASTGINSKESINSDMTEEQKMETRKNLGLYYEETSVGEKTAKRELGSVESLLKIADDTPEKSDIIGVGSYNMNDISFLDYDFGYTIDFTGIVLFQIRNKVVDDYPIGIYALSAATNMTLVYKGETTIVHKIDAKFLPEQESGSQLKWLDVASFPSTNGDEVDISSNISQSDYNDLLDGKYVGIHIQPNAFTTEYYCTILSTVKAQNFVYPSIILGKFGVVGFNADNQLNEVLYLIGSNVTNMFVRIVTFISEVPEPVVLSELPETSMITQVELDAIGLAAANIEKLVRGKASALCLKNSYGLITTHLNLEVAEYLAVNNYNLRFTDKTHRYSVSNAFDTITVTKTALS